MSRNQEHVDRLLGKNININKKSDSETKAELRNVRLQNSSNQNLNADYFKRDVNGYFNDLPKEIAKKQKLRFARQVDEIKKITENDQFIQDARDFEGIIEGNKFKAPFKAIQLAITSRKAVKNHEKHAWTMPFVVALAMDGIISIISAAISTALPIPVFSPGKLMLLCGWLYLFIFLWGTGAKLKARLIMWGCGLIEVFVPFISLLPFSTFAVYLAYRSSEKDYTKAKSNLENVQEEYQDLIIT